MENSAAAETSNHAASAPIKVWLVDDSRYFRSALQEMLAICEGIQCTASFHSPNALLSALASRSGPDVILLDIHLGNANGLDAIRPIKALSRTTQVLMLTTFFDSESKKKAIISGASDFLLKHFPIERILDSIRQAIRNPAPHPKCSPRQNWVASATRPADSPSQPHQPLRWLKNCLDKIHAR